MAEDIAGTPAAPPPAAPAAGTPAAPEPKSAATPSPEPAPGNKGGDDWERQRRGLIGDLEKERRARQKFEADLAAAKAEVESERRRVQALAGVTPRSDADAEADEIRSRFKNLFTREQLLEMMGLSPQEIESFRQTAQDRQAFQETTNHYWARHGKAMVDKVSAELAKEYGSELSKRQRDAVTKAYVLRAQEDPEFLKRHEDGDEGLAAEFAKEWLEDWAEPARRRALANQVNQFQRVPRGQDRSVINHGEKKIDVNNPKEVEDALVAGFRERGGQFGRRR